MFLELTGTPDRRLLRGTYCCCVLKTLYLQEMNFSGLNESSLIYRLMNVHFWNFYHGFWMGLMNPGSTKLALHVKDHEIFRSSEKLPKLQLWGFSTTAALYTSIMYHRSQNKMHFYFCEFHWFVCFVYFFQGALEDCRRFLAICWKENSTQKVHCIALFVCQME